LRDLGTLCGVGFGGGLLLRKSSLFIQLSVDLLLDLVELDVLLGDVDVASSEQAADLSHVIGPDCLVAMCASNGLREANQGF
jgi:hypothetical protein